MATGENNRYVGEGQVGLLFIEPSHPCAPKPLVDSYTKKMAAALRQATRPDFSYRGIHCSPCGATSSNHDHIIGNLVTNSLAVHYLAYHRDEVPQRELDKVALLAFGEVEPTLEELESPSHTKEKWKPKPSASRGFSGTMAEMLAYLDKDKH